MAIHMHAPDNCEQITINQPRRPAATIHVWVPDFAGATGGIQTFSRFLVHGLKDGFPEAEVTVFAKNDSSAPPIDEIRFASFRATGTWTLAQRTLAFSARLLIDTIRRRPDLIVVTHINFAPVAYWLHKLLGVRYLVVAHGVEIWKRPDQQVRTALRNASSLVAVSNYTRDRMSEVLNVSVDEIGLLPNTFDPDNFEPGPKPRFLLKRYGLSEEQPVILTIARLASAERYKGYDQLLQALVDIRKRFPNVCYLLGGRGPDRPRIERMVSQLGIKKNVVLAGYIPDEELNAHYNLCDVFAMPSKGEGFGIVFLEALACGKPVIAGNKDGSVDALLNGKLGVLVDPDNIAEIVTGISTILSERSEVRNQKSAELRRAVIEAYGYPRFVERLAGLVGPLIRDQSR